MASKAVLYLLCLGTVWAHGQDAGGAGVQMALVAPLSRDLRTIADAPGIDLGFHGTWVLPGSSGAHLLRPRVDCTLFERTSRSSSAGGLDQVIKPRFSTLAVGIDYLCRFPAGFQAGLGVSEIRWAVASHNTVTLPGGASTAFTGTAHGWRFGLGPVLGWRLSAHLDAEARVAFSRYDPQNFPANTGSIGLLWHF